MELDATTFVLEIVNFLILLWLLNRFLYRPVQAAIARRQRQAEDAARALDAQRAVLDDGQRQLQVARGVLDAERDTERQRLATEIAAERTRRLDALRTELEDERTKAKARWTAEQKQEARRQDEAAARRAEAFVRHYLERLAGPELERAITGLFLSDLAALATEPRDRLRAQAGGGAIEIATAFTPAETERSRIEAGLLAALGPPVAAHWTIDSSLIAGIAVRLDGHQLEASLARSLVAFAPDSSANS
ncbi:MAG TPA: F0F1 ATP synthase subunit delta [Burkholderiaceae bacterium]|nr:F0F1 ATP synthase subunit delta [Burkholderiaceae bacterium]